MNLFKNCKNRHDISQGCDTLRIGTLYGYRKAEDPDIRDEGEGVYLFKIDLAEPTTLSIRNANIALSPIMHFGELPPTSSFGYFKGYVSNLNASRAGNQVTLSTGKLQLERHAHDQFVFCMSQGSDNPPTISNGYDTHWSISKRETSRFIDGMKEAIIESLNNNPEQVVGLDKHRLRDIRIIANHSMVTYIPREFSTRDLEDQSINEIMDRMSNMSFIKPPAFSKEAEYRFSFKVTDGEKFYPPSSDYMIISSSFSNELLRKGI